MASKLVEYYKTSKVLKFLGIALLALFIAFEFILPMTGLWSPRKPTMTDVEIMRGK
jgi:hypothetical protein